MLDWLFSCFKFRRRKEDRFTLEPLLSAPIPAPVSYTTPLKESKVIYVSCVDADGVFFNMNFNQYFRAVQESMGFHNEAAAYEYNHALADHLFFMIEETGAIEAHMMVGSMRQSHRSDSFNAAEHKTGLYFYWLEKLCHFLNKELKDKSLPINEIKLDCFLMADIDSGTPHGFSFVNSLVDKIGANANVHLIHPEYMPDQGKFPIIYAQMHKKAIENPGDEIFFEFIDDTVETVDGLQQLFEANKDFLPPNLSFQITRHYYVAGEPIVDRSRPVITGDKNNIVDHHYSDSVNKMREWLYEGQQFYSDKDVQAEFRWFRTSANTDAPFLFSDDEMDSLNYTRQSVEMEYSCLLVKYMANTHSKTRRLLQIILGEIRTIYHDHVKEANRGLLEYSDNALNNFRFLHGVLSFVGKMLDESLFSTGAEQEKLAELITEISSVMGASNEAHSLASCIKEIYDIRFPAQTPARRSVAVAPQ